ncbi:MAG: hypothetical protein E7604_03605 [Ruminococcaceae bacterium]|nr:hypothetical protein [Oscillospiraceae bacterium]
MSDIHVLDTAQWIGTDYAGVPVIVRRFSLDAVPGDAALVITGLGYFEAEINGQPVSADKFQPHVTDYERRSFSKITYPCRDTFTHRIYVCRYPVTPLLHAGENVLAIRLGDGFYRQRERVAEGDMSYGNILKTVFALTSGQNVLLVSDGSEVWRKTEIVRSALFLGEIHDRNTDTVTEYPVTPLPAPDAILSEQIGTPDRVIRRIRPTLLGTVGGRKIFDVGENISGIVRLTKPDGTAVLRFAEELTPDGALDFSTTGADYTCTSGVPQIMTDTFIGTGTFEPRFVWHAFRYFDVEGELSDCEVLVIHADTPVTASFSSSSEGLNFLFDAYLRAQLDNMHGSIPSDCPHRERLGYTGDGQNCAAAALMLLDSGEFYRKWIIDILDCQSPDTGHIQHTAPFQGGGGGPGGWGCAVVIVPYEYYRQTGDTSVLAACYPAMKKWIGYLHDHSEGGLVVREEDGGWCLGDWCTYDPCVLPEPLVNTYFFIRSLRMMEEIAAALGYTAEAAAWRTQTEPLCDALRKTYFADGHFCGGIQGADAYALDLGLLPDAAADTLAANYDALGHFDTGFLGTDVLLRVLLEHGHTDTAFRLLDGENCGTFLYMKRHGATTLWEAWNGGSHNHPMFGAPTRYLFTYFLGIQSRTPGWSDIVIAPQMPTALSDISGTLRTPCGDIGVSLHRDGDTVCAKITLPAGVSAQFIANQKIIALCDGEHEIIF